MKFVDHLSSLVSQNSWLKLLSIVLAGLLFFSVCVILTLALRKPLIIEQGCDAKVARESNKGVTEEEIRTFLKKVLPKRFDSNAKPDRTFFEDGEILAQEKEQNLLKERSILQRLLMGEIEIKNDTVIVKADRLIMVGDIKSVLPLDLKIKLRRETRSESNPYGLIITRVEPLTTKKEGGQ